MQGKLPHHVKASWSLYGSRLFPGCEGIELLVQNWYRGLDGEVVKGAQMLRKTLPMGI
jgi:hypothetical protein